MQVRTHNGVTELKVTTITLEYELDDPRGMRVYMFHCPHCGWKVCQYTGTIVRMFPGMEPVTAPIIVQCQSCDHKYMFRSIV